MTDTQQASLEAKPLRLELPEPTFESIIHSDHDGSSPDDQGVTTTPEEDAHSVVGVSISRAQTILMSPQAPAAEKAAAMAGLEDGGLFDGIAEDPHEKLESPRHQNKEEDPIRNRSERAQTLPRSPHTGLPSPWRATPKTFERPLQKHQEHDIGSMGMLADLNFRRYISSLSFPSLPKASSFRDIPVPSLSSVFSGTRSRSPLRKGTRQKRASTLDVKPGPDFVSQYDRSPTRVASRAQTPTSPRNATNNVQKSQKSDELRDEAQSRNFLRSASHERVGSSAHNANYQQVPRLHRATSDQSLFLRRATSTGSSLGDDSRWENVQDQVNSRMKALVDSLQDSSFKLPTMPNIGPFNLNAFRPDFMRLHGHTDAKQLPQLIEGNPNARNAADIESGNTSSRPREGATTAKIIGSHANRKTQKSTHPYLKHALEHLTGDIVIMGGYRGSVLRSAKPPNRQLWVPVKVGLNIRRVNLEIGLNQEDEENMRETIIPSGMLSHIGPVDMGKRLLKRMRHCKNAREGRLRVHDYGYDWRLSPHLLSRHLIKFLETLPSNASGVPSREKGATVIAHSMGGLITRHAVNQRPELFAGVVYAGVPQHCVNILGPIRNGDEILLSSKVLTAQVNFTLRSSFLLLPDDGICFINKETKEEYPVDFFDVESWKKYAFSPCIAPVLPAANPTEKKGLLGSLSDNLPHLPGMKSSSSNTNGIKSSSTDTTDKNLSKLADSSINRVLDPEFSPPSNTNTTLPLPLAITYLTRTLAQILQFRHELAHIPAHQASNLYPPLATLYATNTPTVNRARVSSRAAIRNADAYDDLQFGSGDGVCLARAAQVPDGYALAEGGRVRTERGHVGLLGDLEAVGRCLRAVGRARREGVGLGEGGGGGVGLGGMKGL